MSYKIRLGVSDLREFLTKEWPPLFTTLFAEPHNSFDSHSVSTDVEQFRAALPHFLRAGAICTLDEDVVCLGWQSPNSQAGQAAHRFYSPSFFEEDGENPADDWAPARSLLLAKAEVADLFDHFLIGEPAETFSWSEPTAQQFAEQFESLQTLIQAGVLAKGVPYAQICTSALTDSTWVARRLQHALRHPASAFVYGKWDKGGGIIGCSPERLCQFDSRTGRLCTEAVAGTLPLESYQPGLLAGDTKTALEHALVIEDLQQRLSLFGDVEVGVTTESSATGLVHLRTPVSVTLRDKKVSLKEVVAILHPTAALGAYPRNASGHHWLREIDRSLPRWRFGAPFGVSWTARDATSNCRESFACLVAIRNVQWRGQDIRINAGCGVIAPSNFDAEWQECLAKIRVIKTLLDL